MSVLRWEDPPANRGGAERAPRRSAFWMAVAAQLRARPGRWAVVLEKSEFSEVAGMASQMKSGKLVAFRPAGAFEAQTRTITGRYVLYVRYVGVSADLG